MNKIVYDSYYYGHPSKSSTMLDVALDAKENAKVMNASEQVRPKQVPNRMLTRKVLERIDWMELQSPSIDSFFFILLLPPFG